MIYEMRNQESLQRIKYSPGSFHIRTFWKLLFIIFPKWTPVEKFRGPVSATFSVLGLDDICFFGKALKKFKSARKFVTADGTDFQKILN